MIKTTTGRGAQRRRVRLTRHAGQSLVLSGIGADDGTDDAQAIEVRVTRVCAQGVATLEVLLPENVFVECKETLDGVRALFATASA